MARDTKVGILITGDSKGAVTAINLTTKEVEELDKVTKKTSASVKKNTKDTSDGFLGISKSALAMIGGFVSVGAVIGKFAKETSESEAVTAQLNATILATGGAAGKSVGELQKTANALMGVTTFGDEAILSMDNVLLRFKDIKGDTFDRTAKSVLNLATSMKMDLNSAAALVGKALETPEKGLDRLKESGVNFTASQKDTIIALVETGRKAEAQEIILQKLEERFNGSAEAARDTLGGALKALTESFSNLFELDAGSSDKITGSINDLNKAISDPAFKEGIDNLVSGLLSVVEASAKALGALTKFGHFLGEFAATTRDHVDGTAEGIARISVELDAAKKKLADFNAGGGNKQTLAYSTLTGNVDRLSASLLLSETAYGQASHAADGYAKELLAGAMSTDKANTSNQKFTLVVNNGTAATKTNTKATNDNVDISLKSQKTRDKESAALEKVTKAHEALKKRLDASNKSIADTSRELDDIVRSDQKYIETLQYEVDQLQVSERQQFINNKVREAGKTVTAEQIAEIEKLSATLYDQGKAVEESTKAWGDARSTLSNFFFEMASDGESAFETLTKGFTAMLNKMAAEAATNTIMLAFGRDKDGKAIPTSPGTAATSGGSSLLSKGLSTAGKDLYDSIASFSGDVGLTKISDMAKAKSAATTGKSVGFDLAGGIAGSYLGSKAFGETSGIGATAGGIAGSILIPIPGLGAAIGSFIGTGLEKVAGDIFGQKNDGNNRGFADFNLATGGVKSGGVGKSFDQANIDTSEKLVQQLQAFSDAIGGSSLAANVTVGKGKIDFGGQSFGDADSFFKEAFKGVIEASTNLDERLKPLILGFDGTAEQMATFATGLVSVDTAAGGISDRVLALVSGFKGTAEEIVSFAGTLASLDVATGGLSDTLITLIGNAKGSADEVLRFSTAVVSISQQGGINTVTNAIKEFTTVAPSASVAYADHTALLIDQISAFDGSAESAESLNNMLLENKTAAYDFAMSIQTIGKALNEASADQAQSIRESVLSADELQKKRTAERDALIKGLGALTDPEQVAANQKRILELNQQVFDGLGEGQKKSQAETFASIAENTNTVAQGILTTALGGLQATQEQINTRVSQMLDAAAIKQQAAADTQVQAANTNLKAATALNNAVNALATRTTAEIDV